MKPVVRSLARPDAFVVSSIFRGGGKELVARYSLWRSFAFGESGAVLRPNEAFFGEDGPSDYARRLAAPLREISGPLGEVLVGAEPTHDGIAIYLSPESVRVGWMLDSQEDGDAWRRRTASWETDHSSVLLARVAAERLLEDAGFGYRFATREHLLGTDLDADGVRVLFLPRVVALADDEVRAIREFVRRGGIAIADFGTALFTGSGRSRGEGALDDLFGVKRRDFAAREKGGWPDGGPDDRFAGAVAMEPGLLADGGTPAGRVDGVPVSVRKRTGEGFAVYLNLGLPDSLVDRRRRGGGRELRDLVKGYLSEAGVRPRVSVARSSGGTADRVLVLTYRRGTEEIVVLLRNWQVEELRGEAGDFAEGLPSAEPVRLLLPEAREVTNVRTGERYGKTLVVEATLAPLEPLVFRLR
jgi:hypothetical protein